jgi:AmiR/NasT family two-component response regulator
MELGMADAEELRLRVLVADGNKERLGHVTSAVTALGHEVLRETELRSVGPVTAEEKPDVAMVVVSEASPEYLEMIGRIVHEAACPVIAILDVQDRAFVQEAAKRGIFAYLTEGVDPQELQSSIDIVLRRFAEYHNLEGAFGRRAVTERAKGILMERHGIDEHEAFALLRRHARETNRKIVDMAEAILAAHTLLPSARREEPSRDHEAERLGEER